MMIYKPKGKAREYSPYSCNNYVGCDSGCLYCYASRLCFKTREEFLKPIPKKNAIWEFEKDCRNGKNKGQQILFCFITDPYNSLERDLKLTRQCLEIALEYKVPVSILTKRKLVLRDTDLFIKFGDNIQVGLTLTCDNSEDSKKLEPNASLPWERIECLKELHENGIKTWVSLEPIIYPSQSAILVLKTSDYVDHYKVGKINYFKQKNVDWNEVTMIIVNLLRSKNKQFYIKESLRQLSHLNFQESEIDQDRFNLKWIDNKMG